MRLDPLFLGLFCSGGFGETRPTLATRGRQNVLCTVERSVVDSKLFYYQNCYLKQCSKTAKVINSLFLKYALFLLSRLMGTFALHFLLSTVG